MSERRHPPTPSLTMQRAILFYRYEDARDGD